MPAQDPPQCSFWVQEPRSTLRLVGKLAGNEAESPGVLLGQGRAAPSQEPGGTQVEIRGGDSSPAIKSSGSQT